jgi:type I restriction enzyme M protein
VSLANIPYGVRYRKRELRDYRQFPEPTLFGEVINIQHVLDQTKRTAVVIVPNGLLSRTAARERQFKDHLLKSGFLQAVIGLPPLFLTTTNIGFSILVLNKEEKSGEVLFINASSENFFDEKKERAFFDGSRWRLKNIDEIFQLFKRGAGSEFSRLATLNECRSLKNEIQESGITCYEVALSDIAEDGYIRQPKKTIQLSEKGFDKTRPLILRPHDIILAVKDSIGKVGLVPPDLNDTWIANQSFQIIRIKPDLDINNPTVLFRYLCSPAGQKLLQSRVSGTTVPLMQTRDVRDLPIPALSLEEQKIISDDHYAVVEIYKQIDSLRKQAEAITAKHWPVQSESQSHLSAYSRS